MFALNAFEKTWEITSDAIAAWFAWILQAKKFVIFKSMDGLFKNGDITNKNKLIREIFIEDLIQMGNNALDACVAPFLFQKNMDCYIINGENKEEFISILNDLYFYGTKIVCI